MKRKFNFKASNVPDLIQKGHKIDFVLGSGEVVSYNEQENLELQIRTYDANYRAGTPICTDEAYDKLVEELAQKFPDSVLLKKGVIEQKQKESRKQKLPMYMGSLNKCKSLDEIKQWLKSNNISDDELLVITPKYDGISLVVQEQNGACWTRGDGEEGQISDDHFAKMNDKHCGVDLFSFGEAIMSKSNFQKYKDKFANARNMVAGLFNRDIAGVELNDVDYMRYGSDQEKYDKNTQLVFLNRMNEVSVPFYQLRLKNISEEMLNSIYGEWSEDYNIDGLVIDINSTELRNQLGREENMNPKYARAYKNPDWSGSAEVRVTGITWQVSKQGKLKPVINIEPTEVSGVTIENVTGYNAAYMIDNRIAPDSIIKIIRSGDVIPKHIETISYDQSELEDLQDCLTVCPCCFKPTKWDETMTELICTNPDCQDKQIAKLVHFFSTLEIEDFGEPSIRTFYLSGFKTIEAILNMKQIDIISIEGFGVKSSIKLLSQFGKLRTEGVPAAKIMHACDVFEGKIGEKTVQLILDNIHDQMVSKAISIEDLIKIDGVAEVTAKIFLNGLKSFDHYLEVLPIRFSYITTPKEEITGDSLKGERICFTGCRPSKEMEKKIQQQGGEVVSGVSKNTTMLVVKDLSELTLSSNKALNANKLGIKIVEMRNFI